MASASAVSSPPPTNNAVPPKLACARRASVAKWLGGQRLVSQREPTPTMEIHPADAAALGLGDGDPARVTSRRNSLTISCRISKRVARGQVFVPFHFREAAANLLTNPVLDPYAKMAELKCCAVRIEPVD